MKFKFGALLCFAISFIACEKQEDSKYPEIVGTGHSQMIFVEAGTYNMGSNELSAESTSSPEHSVTFTKSFYMGRYEVTQGMWTSIMKTNPSKHTYGGYNKPVESISWYEAIEFCNAYSDSMGLKKVYIIDKTKQDVNNNCITDNLKWAVTIDETANGYRLPTEAQWEFAARGGVKSKGFKYSGSNNIDDVARYGSKEIPQGTATIDSTYVVGTKQPNELGFFDMSGNVNEYCFDWHSQEYSANDQIDPIGEISGSARVIRGGSFNSDAKSCESTYRNAFTPNNEYGMNGLRLVKMVNVYK